MIAVAILVGVEAATARESRARKARGKIWRQGQRRQVQQLAASPPDSQRYLRSCESSRHKRSSCCSSCSGRRSGKTATSVNRCWVLHLSSKSQTCKGGVHACGRVSGKSVVQTRTCSTGGERRRTRVKGKASEDAAPTVVSEVQSLL